MSQEPRFVRNPEFIFRKIVDELVLVPVHQNLADMDSIFTLNEVGAFLWEKLQEPLSLSAIRAIVSDAYDVDPGVVSTDIDAFMKDMRAIGSVLEA